MYTKERAERAERVSEKTQNREYLKYKSYPRINQLTEEQQIELIEVDPVFYSSIAYPSDKLKRVLIENNPKDIYLIENPSAEMQELATTLKPKSIMYIKNPSLELQMKVVHLEPDNIYFILKPDPKVLEYILLEHPISLNGLSNPTNSFVELLLERNNLNEIKRVSFSASNIRLIYQKNPSLLKYLRLSPGLKTLLNELAAKNRITELIPIIERNPFWVIDMKNPSNELLKIAIKKNPAIAENLRKEFMDDEEIIEFIKKNPQQITEKIIEEIQYLSDEQMIDQVKILGNSRVSYTFIKNFRSKSENIRKEILDYSSSNNKALLISRLQDEDFNKRYINSLKQREIKELIELQGEFIKYIDRASEELKFIAVKNGGFLHIKNPSKELVEYAISLNPLLIMEIKETKGNARSEARNDARSNARGDTRSDISLTVQMMVVSKDPYLIKYIKEPYEQTITAAIEKDPRVITVINNPTETDMEIAFRLLPNLLFSGSKNIEVLNYALKEEHITQEEYDEFIENQ